MGVEETGFCEGGHKLSCPLMRVPVRRASAVLILPFLSFLQTVLSSHQCVFCKELGLCFASSSTELLLTGSVCWWFQGIPSCFNWSNFCGPCEYSCMSVANVAFRVLWVHSIKSILYKSYTWLHQTLTTKLPLELINSSADKIGNRLLLDDNNFTDFQNYSVSNR